MTQNVKENFLSAGSPTSLTVTGLSSLVSGSSVTSNAVDNYNAGNNLYTDCMVTANLTTGGSGTSTTGYTEVYLSASPDNVTFPAAGNDILLDVIAMTANSTAYAKTFTVAKGMQGVLPLYFKLRFNNQCGSTLTSATVVYNLINFTIA